jgi:hypothetical protein
MEFGSLLQFRVLNEIVYIVLDVCGQVLVVWEGANTWSKNRPNKPQESLIRQNVAQDEPKFSLI